MLAQFSMENTVYEENKSLLEFDSIVTVSLRIELLHLLIRGSISSRKDVYSDIQYSHKVWEENQPRRFLSFWRMDSRTVCVLGEIVIKKVELERRLSYVLA